MESMWGTVKLVCMWFGDDESPELPTGYCGIGMLILNPNPIVGMIVGAPIEWLEKVTHERAMSMMCDAMKNELKEMMKDAGLRFVLDKPALVA